MILLLQSSRNKNYKHAACTQYRYIDNYIYIHTRICACITNKYTIIYVIYIIYIIYIYSYVYICIYIYTYCTMVGLHFILTKDEVQSLWDNAFSLRRRFRQTGFRLARCMRPERPLTRLAPEPLRPPPPPPLLALPPPPTKQESLGSV